MITRETDYALRTALYLARQEGDDVVSTAELAEAMAIPYRFLRKIVSKLVAAGLVESRRGKGGGLMLSMPAGDMSLMQVISAVDPASVLLNRCFSDTAHCDRSGTCGIRQAVGDLQRQLHDGLNAITLEAVAAYDRVDG